MFVRKKPNHSGSLFIQVIQKVRGKYKVIKTVGCATTQREIETLYNLARQEIEKLSSQPKLFHSEHDNVVDQVFVTLRNANMRTVGPEIIFGKIYDHIGFWCNQMKKCSAIW
jgi:hypothetical protein